MVVRTASIASTTFAKRIWEGNKLEMVIGCTLAALGQSRNYEAKLNTYTAKNEWWCETTP